MFSEYVVANSDHSKCEKEVFEAYKGKRDKKTSGLYAAVVSML